MSDDTRGLERRLTELRKAFDESFSAPPAPPPAALDQFALIRVAAQPYALRLSEITGLEVNRKVVRVPAKRPALLGLSAVRGLLVPVFSLAQLLGFEDTPGTPRWLALCQPGELVGLAFEHFEGARRVALQEVHDLETAQDRKPLSRQTVPVDSERVHVLDLSEVLNRLRPAAHGQPG